jgi:regulator of sirC expression with transglutaminase-like and TPR domain
LLRRLGSQTGPVLPLVEGAIAFAELERPGIDSASQREHLKELVSAVRQAAGGKAGLDEQVEALGAVIGGVYGYRGDTESYDDIANADILRVIDRRRGLPVTLGILYIHVARAQGWDAAGLNFPGHFLIGLGEDDRYAIVDPFAGGIACDAERLGELLRGLDETATLQPHFRRRVPDREVLLRLQNNIKSRLVQAGEAERAVAVIERMLLLAPDHAGLWYEAGLLNAHLDRFGAAATALQAAIRHAPSSPEREQAALLLQHVRGKLN